jgi:hypothetical protein
MDSLDVINILKTLSEYRLRLLHCAQLVIKETGEVDMDKASFYAKEIAEAIIEAEAYSKATRSAVGWLRSLAHS